MHLVGKSYAFDTVKDDRAACAERHDNSVEGTCVAGPRHTSTRSSQYGSSSMRTSIGFDPVTMSTSGATLIDLRERASSPWRCARRLLASGHTDHRVPANFDYLRSGTLLEKPEKLALRRVERAVGHVVDKGAGESDDERRTREPNRR